MPPIPKRRKQKPKQKSDRELLEEVVAETRAMTSELRECLWKLCDYLVKLELQVLKDVKDDIPF